MDLTFISVLLVIIYVLVCIFLILVVLLQQGKGADLAGAFGGGGSQTSFGPRTGTNIMHRLTTGFFVGFVLLSMALAILSGKFRGESVVADEPTPTPVAAEGESEEPTMISVEPEEFSELEEPEPGETPAEEVEESAETAAARGLLVGPPGEQTETGQPEQSEGEQSDSDQTEGGSTDAPVEGEDEGDSRS